MIFQKEPTERQLKIYKLCNKAQLDGEVLQLYKVIELECGLNFLKNPNNVPECIIRRYNQLVRNSGLPLPERTKLLMEEKKK